MLDMTLSIMYGQKNTTYSIQPKQLTLYMVYTGKDALPSVTVYKYVDPLVMVVHKYVDFKKRYADEINEGYHTDQQGHPHDRA